MTHWEKYGLPQGLQSPSSGILPLTFQLLASFMSLAGAPRLFWMRPALLIPGIGSVYLKTIPAANLMEMPSLS